MTIKLDDATVGSLTECKIHFDGELKGFGVRVRPGANGALLKSWVVQYRFGGVQKRIKIADVAKLDAKRARQRATEMLAQVVLGIDPGAEKQATRTASATTLRSVIDQYLQMAETKLANDSRRASSLRISRLYLTGAYFKPLHAKPINAIDRADVATCLNAIILKHSPNTAKQCRRHLSAFYSWAWKEGIANSNIVLGTNEPEGNGARDRVLKDHELAAIWNACEDAGEFGKIVRLLMLTGCRRSEIGKLRWSWLDLEHENTMTIPATVTKNHNQHVLPLVGMMRDIIDSVPKMLDRDPLFGVRSEGFTGWPHSRLDVDLAEPWTLHDLRRSLSTGMHELGVEPHIVEAILNHASGHKAGVAGTYNYASYGRQMKAALGMWSDHIRSIATDSERKVVPLRASVSA
jgi:integrase